MQVTINNKKLDLIHGDITKERTDAIVNAANSRLGGGGGVDGAIHSAGGPDIMTECRAIGGCPTGEAVITTGGRLRALHVIHTVGPVYKDGSSGEAKLLESAYHKSLKLADANSLTSVSFPSISTGVYGYPVEEASRVALGTTIDFLRGCTDIRLVRFVLFSEEDLQTYSVTLKELLEG